MNPNSIYSEYMHKISWHFISKIGDFTFALQSLIKILQELLKQYVLHSFLSD